MRKIAHYLNPAYVRHVIPRPIRMALPRSLKNIIPQAIRRPSRYEQYAWKRITEYPQRITLTTFHAEGCHFEVSHATEKWRVRGLADEDTFIRAFLAEIQPGDMCFDVGSCVGMYALHAALRGAAVVAFEPDPAYRKRLKRNIRLNRLRKMITVVPWAVSDQPGTVRLYTDGVKGASPSMRQVGERRAVEVKTDTLDRALASGHLPMPTLLKMDIEGAEYLALRGMQQMLTHPHAPRTLYIELHPTFLELFGASTETCTALIESYGYTNTSMLSYHDQMHCIYRKQPAP
jgi:FkbM family methyltransferase